MLATKSVGKVPAQGMQFFPTGRATSVKTSSNNGATQLPYTNPGLNYLVPDPKNNLTYDALAEHVLKEMLKLPVSLTTLEDSDKGFSQPTTVSENDTIGFRKIVSLSGIDEEKVKRAKNIALRVTKALREKNPERNIIKDQNEFYKIARSIDHGIIRLDRTFPTVF